MIVTLKDGKEVELQSFSGASDDIQFEAYYVDNNEEASEDDVEYISEAFASDIYDAWYQHQVARAEFYADLAEDR